MGVGGGGGGVPFNMPVRGNIWTIIFSSKEPLPKKYYAFVYTVRSAFLYYNIISHMQSLNLNLLLLFNSTDKIIGHEDIFPAVLSQGEAGRDPCRVPKTK